MMSKIFPWKTLIWVTIFATAMGFLETSVVVYLRALLYPHGFAFPLVSIPPTLAFTEILREAATMIMLLGAAVLAGRKVTTRFAWFLYAFAIWDIFYYVFLKLLLNWPESWMTWDILFLIPLAWIGPVISPVIISLTMIILAAMIIHFDAHHAHKTNIKLNTKELALLIAGSVILIVAFTWDYGAFILEHYRLSAVFAVPSADLMALSYQYIPRTFNWFLFLIGEIVISFGVGMFWKRIRRSTK
jgi:hypothetical protein